MPECTYKQGAVVLKEASTNRSVNNSNVHLLDSCNLTINKTQTLLPQLKTERCWEQLISSKHNVQLRIMGKSLVLQKQREVDLIMAFQEK